MVLEWFHLNGYARPKEPETEAERAQSELAAAVRAELGTADLAASDPRGRGLVQLIREGHLGVAIVDGSLGAHELAELERVTADWSIVVVAENTARVA